MRMPIQVKGAQRTFHRRDVAESVGSHGIVPMDQCDCERCERVLGRRVCWDDPQCLYDCHRECVECAALVAACAADCAADWSTISCVACLGASYSKCSKCH